MRTCALPVSVWMATALPLWAADPVIGIWQTEPDRKDLVTHVELRQCGDKICGRSARAYDTAGRMVQTPHVGKDFIWDLTPQGDGRYDGGTVYVPLLDVHARASAQLTGDRLVVTGCKGMVCDGQTWRRVR